MPPKKTDARAAEPLDEPELSPSGLSSRRARPIKTREFWDDHWIGFLFLLPFVIMFALHEPLGMTDAFLMGDIVSANYNLMTFAALFFGSSAFVIYAFALPIVKGRGWRWVPPKLIFLVFFWGAVILAMSLIRFLHPSVTPEV